MTILKEIIIYKTPSGKLPYLEWENSLDQRSRAVVKSRLDRVRLGNFGDVKKLENVQGVFELRIDFGPGYRVYFGVKRKTIVLLLMAGDKSSQKRDIDKAAKYWLDSKDIL